MTRARESTSWYWRSDERSHVICSAINQCEDPAIQLERVLDCIEIHDGDPMLHLRALALTEIVFPDDV